MKFKADFARYDKHALLTQPALWAILIYRLGSWTLVAPRFVRPPLHAFYFACYSVIRLLTGIDIPRTAKIGEGLMIHHFTGIILHPSVIIGNNCTLRQGVTIGVRHAGGKPPRIGNNFVAGAYAQILGDISIADDVEVGAMTLMISDGECGGTYVGIPARKL